MTWILETWTDKYFFLAQKTVTETLNLHASLNVTNNNKTLMLNSKFAQIKLQAEAVARCDKNRRV